MISKYLTLPYNILHITPRYHAADLDVCGGVYAIGK